MSIDISRQKAQELFDNIKKGDNCWFWKGKDNSTGHPMIGVQNKRVSARRVAWCVEHPGKYLYKNYCIGVNCGNRDCLRPSHLVLAKKPPSQEEEKLLSKERAMRYTGASEPRRTKTKAKWRDFQSYVRDLGYLAQGLHAQSRDLVAVQQTLVDIGAKIGKEQEKRDKFLVELKLISSALRELLERERAAQKDLQALRDDTADIRGGIQALYDQKQLPGPAEVFFEQREPDPDEQLDTALATAYRQATGYEEPFVDKDRESLRSVFYLACSNGDSREASKLFGEWLIKFASMVTVGSVPDNSPSTFTRMAVALSSTGP